MSKKVSNNEIPNLQEDWGNDSTTGLPYSGKSVQHFIKEQLKKGIEAYDSEITSGYFDLSTNTNYFFKDRESLVQWLKEGKDPESSLILFKVPININSIIENNVIRRLKRSEYKKLKDINENMFYFVTNSSDKLIEVYIGSTLVMKSDNDNNIAFPYTLPLTFTS